MNATQMNILVDMTNAQSGNSQYNPWLTSMDVLRKRQNS